MRAMSVTIARCIIRQIIGVEPIVIMVKSTITIITSVLLNKCLMRKTHTRIDIGNHKPRAIYTHCPDVVRINMRQVRLYRIQTIIYYRGTSVGFIQDICLPRGNSFNFRKSKQAV